MKDIKPLEIIASHSFECPGKTRITENNKEILVNAIVTTDNRGNNSVYCLRFYKGSGHYTCCDEKKGTHTGSYECPYFKKQY